MEVRARPVERPALRRRESSAGDLRERRGWRRGDRGVVAWVERRVEMFVGEGAERRERNVVGGRGEEGMSV